MVSLTALWLPILVATVIVYIASFVLNTVMPHHKNNFAPLPNEAAFGETVRAQGLAPGQYAFPQPGGDAAALQEKVKTGPVGILIIGENVAPPTPKQLGLQFVYMLVISLMAGYLGSATLPAGVDYLKVFQVTGTAAFLGYAGALFMNSNWFHMTWSSMGKHTFDGLVYALLTAGVFGWLWP